MSAVAGLDVEGGGPFPRIVLQAAQDCALLLRKFGGASRAVRLASRAGANLPSRPSSGLWPGDRVLE